MQVGAQKPHTTVDVIAHTPGGDHPVIYPGSRHTAYREAIAPMDIRHGQGASHNTGQESYIGHLVRSLFLPNAPQHLLAGIDKPGNPHPLFIALWNLPAVLANLVQWSFPTRHALPPLNVENHPNTMLSTVLRHPEHVISGCFNATLQVMACCVQSFAPAFSLQAGIAQLHDIESPEDDPFHIEQIEKLVQPRYHQAFTVIRLNLYLPA